MRPFDESDLIAYHLHELPSPRVRKLLQAFQNDPSLVAESISIAAMLEEYKNHTPTDVDMHAFERNWQAVRHALPRVPVAPTPFFRWRLPVLAGAGLALAVPIFFAVHHLDSHPVPQQGASSSHTLAPMAPSAVRTQEMHATTMPGMRPSGDSAERTSLPHTTQLHSVPLPLPQNSQSQAPQAAVHTAEPVSSPFHFPLVPAPPIAHIASQAASSSTQENAALAQLPVDITKPSSTRGKPRHSSDTDLTLSMGGTFIATRGTTTSGVTSSEGANNTVNVIGSFHQQFRPFVGYRVAVSYTRPQFHYFRSTATSTSGEQGIKGRVYELAGTYVVRGPRREKLITYVEAGAGMMAILPPFPDTATDYNISPAGIVGVSADIPVSKHFGVHAAYRAQVFKGPDFRANPAVYPLANSNILISQEPSVGITYRFTQKQQQ